MQNKDQNDFAEDEFSSESTKSSKKLDIKENEIYVASENSDNKIKIDIEKSIQADSFIINSVKRYSALLHFSNKDLKLLLVIILGVFIGSLPICIQMHSLINMTDSVAYYASNNTERLYDTNSALDSIKHNIDGIYRLISDYIYSK